MKNKVYFSVSILIILICAGALLGWLGYEWTPNKDLKIPMCIVLSLASILMAFGMSLRIEDSSRITVNIHVAVILFYAAIIGVCAILGAVSGYWYSHTTFIAINGILLLMGLLVTVKLVQAKDSI